MFIDMTSSVWVSIIFATTDAGAAVDSFLRYYAAATANEQVLRLLTPRCTPSPSVSTVPMQAVEITQEAQPSLAIVFTRISTNLPGARKIRSIAITSA